MVQITADQQPRAWPLTDHAQRMGAEQEWVGVMQQHTPIRQTGTSETLEVVNSELSDMDTAAAIAVTQADQDQPWVLSEELTLRSETAVPGPA